MCKILEHQSLWHAGNQLFKLLPLTCRMNVANDEIIATTIYCLPLCNQCSHRGPASMLIANVILSFYPGGEN